MGKHRDITERKREQERLQHSEERYRVFVEQAADGIFLTNVEGYFVDVNPAFCLLSGYTREELLTKNIVDLAREEDREGLFRGRDAIVAGQTLRSDWLICRRDSSLIRTEFSSKQLSNGYIQGIVHDISTRIQAEKERARLLASEQAAHAEAEQARTHLHDLFMQAPANIAIVRGPQHRFELVNPPFLQTIGLTEQEVLGRPTKEVIPLISKQGYMSILDEVYATGQPFRGTEMLVQLDRRGNGTIEDAFFSFVYQPFRNMQGEIEGILIHGVEVTDQVLARRRVEDLLHQLEAEQEALRQAERRYRALLDSNIIGVYVSDLNGKIYEANDCLAEMFGYKKEELLADGFRWYQFNPPDYDPTQDPVVQSCDSHGVIHLMEKEHIRKDGSRFPTLMAGAIFDQEQERAVMVFLDISDRKEAERRKQEFLGMVNHELRTPLTIMMGFLELAQMELQQLHRHGSSETDAVLNRVEMALARANQQVSIESRLVEALLDVSRIEMHKFELSLKPCNLITLIEQVLADQRHITHDRRIDLYLPPQEQVPVLIDEDRITQVLSNYLTNALKYSPTHSAISVTLTVENTTAHVYVGDQGPGLTPSEQEHIWERFYQTVPSMNRGGEGGLGLGLYITRIIVQQHGGRVGVESEPGQGSTFWFTLPLIEA